MSSPRRDIVTDAAPAGRTCTGSSRASSLDARHHPGASRHGQAHSGGAHETIGLPVTQMETAANTKMPAHRIPMLSQNFAVVMASHVTNIKDIVRRLAGERDPKAAAPPNRFTRGLPGPMDLSIFPRLDPLGRPPEGGNPADSFTERLPGPMDLSVFPRLDPLGRPPEGGDPADRFTKRLPGPPITRSSNFPVRWARARRPPTRRISPPEGFLADRIHPPEGFWIPWSAIRRPNSTMMQLNKIRRSTIKNFGLALFSCG